MSAAEQGSLGCGGAPTAVACDCAASVWKMQHHSLPTRLCCWLPPCNRAHLSSKVWSHRARRLVRMAFAELTVALVNSVAFLIPNACVGWLGTPAGGLNQHKGSQHEAP